MTTQLSKKLGLPALFAASAFFASGTFASNTFTVEEGVIPGSSANQVIADEIIGSYREVVEFTSATDFDVSIAIQFNAYELNDVQVGGAKLSGPDSAFEPESYTMYSLFLGSGTYSTSGGTTNFNFTSGSYDLWADPLTDTDMTSPGTGAGAGSTPYSLTNAGEDLKLASGAVLDGGGFLVCAAGDNCGAFGTDLSVGLTPFGKTFFIDPVPFYNVSFTSGDFEGFAVAPGTAQEVAGKIGIIFNVPAPGGLARVGLGLLGLARIGRRKA